jgi:hypothetical protein
MAFRYRGVDVQVVGHAAQPRETGILLKILLDKLQVVQDLYERTIIYCNMETTCETWAYLGGKYQNECLVNRTRM